MERECVCAKDGACTLTRLVACFARKPLVFYYDYDCRSYRETKQKELYFPKATNETKRINIITFVNPLR
jgi:hypothetical protein